MRRRKGTAIDHTIDAADELVDIAADDVGALAFKRFHLKGTALRRRVVVRVHAHTAYFR